MKSRGRSSWHPAPRTFAAVTQLPFATLLTFILLLAVSPDASAQSGEWTYQFGFQGGATSAADFGTKGVPSILNNPGAREGGITWTDASGNLWMFGGYGDSSGYIGYLNDLWMWNVTTKVWTWMGGDGGVLPPYYANAGVYGTQGVASATNLPGGRVGAQSWIDSAGKVWMFGGQGADANGTVGSLNDVWRYDPGTQQWTWIAGPTTIPALLGGNPAVYGTLGVAAAANTPGGRDGATTWLDASGNLWLFGGEYVLAKNDLWMFSTSTGQWTWEGGAQTTGSSGTSGLPGIASATAMPPARVDGFGWVDPQHNFWLFGGNNNPLGSNITAPYNDLWEYNPATGQWTYWNGSTTASASNGSYGTLGIAAQSNEPPGRAAGSAWTDANGNLWLFGGTQSYLNNNLNDLWLYTPSSNEWTWMGGSTTVQAGGTYGPQGTPTATAYPGARDAQFTWLDGSGNLWMFAGWNSEPFDVTTAHATPTYWNDLWEYAVPTIHPPAVTVSPLALSFRTVAGTPSAPQNVTLTNHGSSPVSLGTATVSGANSTAYQVTDNCSGTLAAGASCTIGVLLSSASPASLPATLVINDSDPNSPQNVVLDGYAVTSTTTSLSGTTSILTTDASDTLTIVVNPTSGKGTPTGTVTLQAGSTTITTLTLGASGSATYTIKQPPVGTTSYTARYSGDLNYGGSSSSAFTVNSIANPTTTAPAWAWLNGTSGILTTPIPVSAHPTDPAGTGVASTSNYPGIRYDLVTWADTNGNLYLFGGLDFDDLWKYNIASGAWTLLDGTFTLGATLPPSVFGTKGIAAPSNMPGSRTYASRWIDARGNLWLFGGEGPYVNGAFGPLNDLWMYAPATNEWTWMGGDQTVGPNYGQGGVYGTLGVAAAANKPGGRYEAVTWVDKSGNLWLFGGVGMDSTDTQNFLNDLWMYNVSTNQWTWEAGANSGSVNGDVFVAQGLASAGNTPSAREDAMSWVDASGRLWLFGGSGYGIPATGGGELNDLWMFDPSTSLWTYVAGTTTVNAAGTYGTLGSGSTNNVPPAREKGATFTDAAGNFWLFGGTQASYVNNTATETPFNDLWMYSPATDLWTWVAGSNTPGSTGTYGTQGTASTANIPGARLLSASWTDNNGNFWLLGGTNVFPYNQTLAVFDDLWKATPAATSGAAAVNLSPSGPLSFSTQSGTASATQSVTLTNSGTATLTGITVGLSSGLGAFSEANNCPSSLAAGMSCTITIGFTPTAVTTYTGSVLMMDSASNSPQSIALTGTGTGTLAPAATIYPTSLSFAPTMVNTTNSGQTISLANTGNAPLTGITASITGANASDFAISSNTCSALTLGGTCTISVTFTPPTTGTFNATLSIADNAANSPQTVPISGTGIAASELGAVTPGFVAFANQAVNTTSGTVTVTLANAGSTALTNIAPAITGAGASAFAITATSCTASLAAGANCSLSIAFTPGSTATYTAALTIADDASNSPQVVPLSGTGTIASTTSAATLSTTSLTFPNTAVGASAPLQVTVTNSGSQPLSLDGIAMSNISSNGLSALTASTNGFTQTSNCGTTLAAGASCVVTVTFSPTAGSLYSGTLLIADSSSSLAQAVALTGIGMGGSGTSAVLSPPLNFGTVALNTTSAPMTAILTNTGSVTLTGITPSLTSGTYFAISSTTCGSSLAAGSSCTIAVTQTSASVGQYGAVLEVADSAPNSPQGITLSGSSNCPTTPDTNCNPGGSQVITNTYGIALAFQPSIVTRATATAASTEIIGKYQGTVVYDQTFAAAYGTPTVQAGVTAANAAVAAAGGTGVVVPAPVLVSSSTSTSTTSASVYSEDPAASVATTGETTTFGPATIRAAAGGSGGTPNPTFDSLDECTETGQPSSTIPTCYATDPGIFQIYSGQTDINLNNTVIFFIDTVTTTTTTTTTATAYSINGTSATTAPAVSLMPSGPLSFSANASATSAAQTVTITNSGTASLSLTGLSITGANASTFSETNNCGLTLAAGATCSVSITFSPSLAGSDSATLSVADNASGSPQTVALNGTANPGPAPVVSLLPSTALSFSATAGTTSAVQTVTVTNAGNASLSITAITIGGANSSSFAETNTCGSTLAASGSCNVSITFSPATAASYTATLSIADNATGSPQTLALNGTGTQRMTMTTIAASGTSVTQGSSVTFTATVTPASGTAAATGTVTFYDGAIAIGTGTLNSGDLAIFATSTLAVGSHSIKAGYGGDTNDATSTSAAVNVTVNAPASPAATLTPAGPLNFTATTGSTSAAQTVMLTNTGNAALSITAISLTGVNASDFAEINTCGASLAAGSSCAISITFTPASAASSTATLNIADNAANSPQAVALSGTGTAIQTASFTLSSATPSATVTPSTPATYQILVTPQNGSFASPVSLSVGGLPANCIASFSTSTLTPGATAATSTLTIKESSVAANLVKTLAGPALALTGILFWPGKRRRRLTPRVLTIFSVMMMLMLGVLSGCSGGFSLFTSQSYNLTVTATGAGVTQSTTVQLTVQQ